MGESTNIQWTDHTFNPWTGCVKVSDGCRYCYAEHAATTRIARAQGTELWGKDAARKPASESYWRDPERWNRKAEKEGRKHRVFCASLADVFEDRRDLDVHRARLFDLIRRTPWLDWQLLTKRPENILGVMNVDGLLRRAALLAEDAKTARMLAAWCGGEPPLNVWVGTTVEDQAAADLRVPVLLQVPAEVRFLSCEPLLGEVHIAHWLTDLGLRTRTTSEWGAAPAIHWVIVGGESGSHARASYIGSMRSLVEQVQNSGAACFVKQLGANVRELVPSGPLRIVHTLHPKGGDPLEWPKDLRVREMPTSGLRLRT